MTDITIHMRNNDGLENYLKKKKKNFSHPGESVLFARVRESGSISGRLPDDPREGSHVCNYQWVARKFSSFIHISHASSDIISCSKICVKVINRSCAPLNIAYGTFNIIQGKSVYNVFKVMCFNTISS